MDFQVVVLAGGCSKTLVPLVSKEVPKALLPVANRPVLCYVLELLELNDLNNAVVVAEGESAALLISAWISSTFDDRLQVEVISVPEDIGTAGALRAIDHRLTAKNILVVSGDLVCEVSPGAVAAAHSRHDAVVTAMLCSVPVSGPSDSGSSGAKDKAKKAGRYNIIGLDPTKQFLLHIAAGSEVEKDIRVQKSILRVVGQMEIHADLMDSHMYAFKRSVLQDILNQKENFQSLRRDVLPYLVRSQLRSELLFNGVQSEENGNGKDAIQNNKAVVSQLLANASTPSFHDIYARGPDGSAPISRKNHKCCVYIANKSKYCSRLNSIQAFSDINRDVVGDANHLLSGYSFSAQNNIIHPSAILGSKTTVGPQCMVGEGSQMGDKCSVKKSVIGRHCRIGSNVKIVNSVVMNYVTIGDGCSIQGSIICSNVQLQERAILKDCQGRDLADPYLEVSNGADGTRHGTTRSGTARRGAARHGTFCYSAVPCQARPGVWAVPGQPCQPVGWHGTTLFNQAIDRHINGDRSPIGSKQNTGVAIDRHKKGDRSPRGSKQNAGVAIDRHKNGDRSPMSNGQKYSRSTAF